MFGTVGLPHGFCFLWDPGLLWLNVVSDSLIALAYFLIAVGLIRIVIVRKEIPFNGVFFCFAAFIIACGVTHVMEVVTLWRPIYWVSGTLKALTAAISLLTLAVLIRISPKLLSSSRELADRRYRDLIEDAPDAILQAGRDGRIVIANRTAEAMFGYSREELIGSSVDLLLPEANRAAHRGHRTDFQQAGVTRPMGRNMGDLHARRKDGTEFPVEVGLSPGSDEGCTHVTAMIRDVTLRKAAEESLRRSEETVRLLEDGVKHAEEIDRSRLREMEIKEEFLSHVSHELRSPLTSIYSFTSLIVDGLAGEVGAEQMEYMQIILRNVQQLLSMIEDLLEDAQLRAGKLHLDLQCASVAAVTGYAMDTLRGASERKSITLAREVSPDLPSVYADPMRLRQVLTVLLDNAVKFTAAGGAVEVRASVFPLASGFLLVEVSDTGVGIRPEALERIFERLYQAGDPSEAGRRGLGLGLHIAKGLVTNQGGRMWVESKVGEGSRFFFTVPIFDLSSLLVPILIHEVEVGEELAVFKVDLRAPEGEAVPREVREEARRVLPQSLRPETDVLLPKTCSASEDSCLFVVAYSPRHGAEILSRRMQRHLQGTEVLRLADLAVSISYSFPAVAPKEVNESMEIFADRVASGVQEQIDNLAA